MNSNAKFKIFVLSFALCCIYYLHSAETTSKNIKELRQPVRELCKFIKLPQYPDQGSAVNTLRSGLFFVRNNASMWEKMSPFYTRFYKKRVSGELKVLKKHPALKYNLWLGEKPGDIVFIIPGTGENFASFGASKFAQLFNKNGYSAVVISNSFNWEFMEAAGTTIAPGCVYADSLDVVRVLKKLTRKLQKDYPGYFKRKILLGTSMGAMQVLFISDYSVREKKKMFDKYIAINPPVDMRYAMDIINKYYLKGAKWGKTDISKKVKECIAAYMNIMGGNSPDASPIVSAHEKNQKEKMDLQHSQSKITLNKDDAEFLIGLNFHLKLVETIYSIFMRGLTDAVKAEKTSYDQREIYKEIEKFNFNSYLNKILMPNFKKIYSSDITIDEVMQKSNLKFIRKTLENEPSLKIFHNQDDFLLSEKDWTWLKNVMGRRLTIFSAGGHLGNLYLPKVQNYILDAVKE